MRGILRQHGRPTKKAAALTTADIKKLVATCSVDLVGLRDKAMILICFAGV
jgi:site-specific recombinase XerD